MSSSQELKPWERQPKETHKAWAAFQAYRSLPADARSIEKAGILMLGSPEIWKRRWRGWHKWSSKNNWVKRAAAWDAEIDRHVREAHQVHILEMQARHIEHALAIQEKGSKRLKKFPLKSLTPRVILDYLIEGIKLERQARGEPGEIIQQQGDMTIEVTWDDMNGNGGDEDASPENHPASTTSETG